MKKAREIILTMAPNANASKVKITLASTDRNSITLEDVINVLIDYAYLQASREEDYANTETQDKDHQQAVDSKVPPGTKVH